MDGAAPAKAKWTDRVCLPSCLCLLSALLVYVHFFFQSEFNLVAVPFVLFFATLYAAVPIGLFFLSLSGSKHAQRITWEIYTVWSLAAIFFFIIASEAAASDANGAIIYVFGFIYLPVIAFVVSAVLELLFFIFRAIYRWLRQPAQARETKN